MKKILFSALILSLLLATLTACGAEAKQSQPEPAPKIEEPKPEPLAAPEKTEISQEELEPIFEQVYAEASGNHPEDWSIDFQITDEIGKITKAIPDDKKAPANLREIYTEWRTAKTTPEPTAEPEPEPENTLTFTDCNETVYAISQVNLRSGPGTNYDKVGSLSTGNSAVRTGIGYNSCDGWSRIQLSDGSTVYVSSNYLSYNKPAAQATSSTPSSGTNQNNNNGQSNANSNLANSGLDFSGPRNIITPGEGKTQEELEAEWARIDELNEGLVFH